MFLEAPKIEKRLRIGADKPRYGILAAIVIQHRRVANVDGFPKQNLATYVSAAISSRGKAVVMGVTAKPHHLRIPVP